MAEWSVVIVVIAVLNVTDAVTLFVDNQIWTIYRGTLAERCSKDSGSPGTNLKSLIQIYISVKTQDSSLSQVLSWLIKHCYKTFIEKSTDPLR